MRILVFTSLLFWTTRALSSEILGIFPDGEADGKQFRFQVSDADVRNTPMWYPNVPNPPLAFRRAEAIARKQLKQLVVDSARWPLNEILLWNFGDNRWVYVFVFDGQYPPELARYHAASFSIPVLMSGAVVKPEVKVLRR